MASGRSLLRMKFGPADEAGHSCQRSSSAFTIVPWPISLFATSTSTVAELRNRRRRHRFAGATREQRRKATGCNRNPQNDKPRGFHTLHFPL